MPDPYKYKGWSRLVDAMKSAVVIAALSVSMAVGVGQRIPDLDQYRQDLETNSRSSLAHFRIAEIFNHQGNYQGAANEFREALSGEAMAVLRGWRFTPGMKEGMPVSVPCAFEFAWGPRILGSREVARLLSALNPHPAPGSQVWRPEFINTPDPPYPAEARNAGLEGTVTVALVVGEDGAPHDIQVTQGLAPAVDASVTKALAQWRFAPPFLNGQAGSARLMIGVSFELPDHVDSKILDTTPPFLAPGAVR